MFQSRREALALALPAALFAAIVFLVPVALLLSEGFRSAGSWTISPYVDFFAAPLNQTVFLRTLKLGFLVTATAAVLGWCALFAWHLVGRGKPMRVTPLMRFLPPQPSFPAPRPVGALDRIALGGAIRAVGQGVHAERPAHIASDHLPVWADVVPAL